MITKTHPIQAHAMLMVPIVSYQAISPPNNRNKREHLPFPAAPRSLRFRYVHSMSKSKTPSCRILFSWDDNTAYMDPHKQKQSPSCTFTNLHPHPDHPILSMRNPLYPQHSHLHHLSSSSHPLNLYHRQCFTAQIPELGVFIVASPAGRVGIFRLTHTVHNRRPLYGFRMDHLLPLERRDDGGGVVYEGEVNWARQLVGVAVGPV